MSETKHSSTIVAAPLERGVPSEAKDDGASATMLEVC